MKQKVTTPGVVTALPADAVVTTDLLLRRKKKPIFEKITCWYAFFVLVIFPFLYDSNKYYKITAAKFNWFWSTAAIFMFVMAVCALFLFNKEWRRIRFLEKPEKPTWPQYLLFGYMAWACISGIFSEFGGQIWMGTGSRFEGLFSILMYGFVFLLVARYGEASDSLIYAFGIMALLFGFICALQSWGVNLMYPSGSNYWNTMFLGTVGNIDMIAAILAMTVPTLFCASVLLKSKYRVICLPGMAMMLYIQIFSDVDSSKIGILLAFALTMPFLLETKERICNTALSGAVLTGTAALSYWFHNTANGMVVSFGKKVAFLWVVCLLLLAVWFVLPKLNFKKFPCRRMMRIIVALCEVVILIAGLIFLYGYHGSNTLLQQVSEVLHGHLSDSAGSARGAIWKCALHIMAEHPILGGGPGSLCELFRPYNEYYSTSVGSYCEVDFAHNEFLQIGVCVGFVGLLIYLAFIVALAIRAFKAAVRCPMAVILAAGVVGYLGHSFFSFSLAMVTPLYWVMAGLLDKCISQIPPVQKEEQ